METSARGEDALFQRARMLEKILQHAADGICVCHNIPEEPHVRFTHWNPQMVAITGYTMDEINRLGWYQTMYPDPEIQKRAVERMVRMRTGDDIRAEEWTVTRKDGQKRCLSISTSIITEEDEKVHVLAVMHDITERKRAQEELERSEAFIQDVIRSMRDGLFVLNDRFQYLMWNPAMEAISGVPKERVVLQENKPWELFPHLQEVGIDQAMKRAMAGETILNQEVPYYLPSGKRGFTSESYFPLRAANGATTGVIGVIRDISERVELERRLRQVEKAEGLGRMAGAIAHHFNNKLGAVMGNLEMAMVDSAKGGRPDAALTEAMKAARGAADVSGQMLTYLGQKPGRRNTLDLCEVCRRILPMLQAAMPGNVVLETDLPSSGSAVHADANQMEQVITNLVANAWEAIGDSGGAIHLAVETVSASEIPSTHRFPVDWRPGAKAYACLEVRDTGPGISEADIEKLFDPFFTNKFTGRGLGLPVALGIVRAHGGCIAVESGGRAGSRGRGGVRTGRGEDGGQESGVGGQRRGDGDQRSEVRSQQKENLGDLVYPVAPEDGTGASLREKSIGSVFRVYLPLSAEDLARPAEKAAKAPELKGGGKALLIEDDPQVRNLGVRMLGFVGFEVIAAKDGVEGVEMFREHQDDIRFVLSDLTMPRMDGWATIAALRQIDPNVRIILASGYDEASVMSGDHADRPQVFLGKPYTIEDLREAIGKVI
jgi:PAS domain S-box-containing protein